MGSFMSLNCPKKRAAEHSNIGQRESRKRRKTSSFYDRSSLRLIPSLPDELSIQILARLPRIHYFNARLVSQKWNSTLTSPELYNLRKELGKTEQWLYVLTKGEEDKLLWYALDPLSRKWQRMPPMPTVEHEEKESRKSFSGLWNMVGPSVRVAEYVRGWLGRMSASDQMPFCGCAIGAVDGCLYVLGGFSRNFTMRCVWRFNPILNRWNEVSPMLTGRAYSKTGVLNDRLYVVGGVNRGRGGLTPLRSAEVYDPRENSWSEVPSMPFSKAQVLPNAFLADLLKPIATGMTSYNGRLCVPQSLYSWPFFVDVGGEIYEPQSNSWVEMPTGMGEGWPARQAGTKLSVVVDGELYAFDPSSTTGSGKIKVYDQKDDAWKVVIGEVPVYDLTESESPYLLAGFHGKLHVIARDGNHNVAIMRADVRNDFGFYPSSSKPNLGLCSSSSSSDSNSDPSAKPDTVVWTVIAVRDFGAAELVSCQVIDI